jgi:hypothetical protein
VGPGELGGECVELPLTLYLGGMVKLRFSYSSAIGGLFPSAAQVDDFQVRCDGALFADGVETGLLNRWGPAVP